MKKYNLDRQISQQSLNNMDDSNAKIYKFSKF